MVTEETKLVKVFDEHYINITERSRGINLSSIAEETFNWRNLAVDLISTTCQNQLNIWKVK